MLLQPWMGAAEQGHWVVLHWHSAAAPTAIMCPALYSDKAGVPDHRFVFSTIAQHCHALGINALLFDYPGFGERPGLPEQVSLDSLVRATVEVVDEVRGWSTAPVALVGLGVGALITALLAQASRIDAAVLLYPEPAVLGAAADHNDPAQQAAYSRALLGNSFASLPASGNTSELLDALGRLPAGLFADLNLPLLVFSRPGDDTILAPDAVCITVPPLTEARYPSVDATLPKAIDMIAEQTAAWLVEATRAEPIPAGPPPQALLRALEAQNDQRIRPLSWEVGGQRVLGMLSAPARRSSTPAPCVIYQAGLGGNRVDTHACAVRLAEHLSDQGYYVLRYDNRGSGVSAGAFYETTWTRWLEDLAGAITALRSIDAIDTQRLVIMSNSAGAKVACLAANRLPEIAGCALLSPDLFGDQPAQTAAVAAPPRFAKHRSGQLVTPYGSLWLGMDYFRDERRFQFVEEFQRCRKPMLLFLGDADPLLGEAYRAEIGAAIAGQPEKELIIVRGEHQFTGPTLALIAERIAAWLPGLPPV